MLDDEGKVRRLWCWVIIYILRKDAERLIPSLLTAVTSCSSLPCALPLFPFPRKCHHLSEQSVPCCPQVRTPIFLLPILTPVFCMGASQMDEFVLTPITRKHLRGTALVLGKRQQTIKMLLGIKTSFCGNKKTTYCGAARNLQDFL